MTGDTASTSHMLGEDGYVAELLPATAPPPEPHRRIGFFRALLLLWIMPRRYGPHLAVDSFRRALLAHLISVAFAAFVLCVPFLLSCLEGMEPGLSLHERRIELATFVLEQACTSAGGQGLSTTPSIVVFRNNPIGQITVWGLPLGEIAILLIATLVMPWCAGGDRASSVWKRSVKNV